LKKRDISVFVLKKVGLFHLQLAPPNVGGAAPAPEDSQFCWHEMTKHHYNQLLGKLKGNTSESLSSA